MSHSADGDVGLEDAAAAWPTASVAVGLGPIGLVAAMLLCCAARTAGAEPATEPGAAAVAPLWKTYCHDCHGGDGGDGPASCVKLTYTPSRSTTLRRPRVVPLLAPSACSRLRRKRVRYPPRGLSEPAKNRSRGRRSVLVPTEAAGALLQAFLRAKWQRMMKLFATWSEADILTFSTLFGRYNEGMRAQYPGRG
jgi:hypothetical protein